MGNGIPCTSRCKVDYEEKREENDMILVAEHSIVHQPNLHQSLMKVSSSPKQYFSVSPNQSEVAHLQQLRK